MKTVIQRVRRAAVRVDGQLVSEIGTGAVLLVGVEQGDTEADAQATAKKIAALRFFPGATPMDRTLLDVDGACLVVSQFTLAGNLRKGNRPSFTAAEDPERAEQLYLQVATILGARGIPIATGEFGAMMDVELVNDGPVTFLLCTKDGNVLANKQVMA
ncbi:MAG: D-aminoacyl-tRNA deacylase [Planctomycetota bacterium]|jgi:D-tyrosyl-tRNA(Tyr) deacylase